MFAIFLLAAQFHAVQPPAIKADFGNKLDEWGGDVEDFFGYGDHPSETFACSDNALSIRRGPAHDSGKELWVLRGSVPAPGLGFGYRAAFMGVKDGQAQMVLNFGQRIPPPPVGLQEVHIEEKLQMPPRVGFIRLHMEGLTPQPYEVVCDISGAKPW